MNEEQIKAALQDLGVTLEGKSKTETENAIAVFETKIRGVFDAQIETKQADFDAELEAVKAGLVDEIKKVQDYADALDVKLQAKQSKGDEPRDALRDLIRDNFDQIKTVRQGHGVKVVGDMTLAANLTGDQPRVYSNTVTTQPNDLINFVDLVRSFPIDGGTFTFPRSVVSEGEITTQVEGADKSQIDYDISMIDVNTDFLAGFCVYSKKMANNLPFLENFLPQALRRDYFKAENALFYADLAAQAQASPVVGSANEVENIIDNQVLLLNNNFIANAVVVNPVQYGNILKTAGASGTGAYSLPGVVSIVNGSISINGVQVIPAPWVPDQKYIIGDWSECAKVVTQGLSVSFFEEDSDNVRKNNITARVESQIGLAVFNTGAFRAGDFTAV